jgi:hypothetical protein
MADLSRVVFDANEIIKYYKNPFHTSKHFLLITLVCAFFSVYGPLMIIVIVNVQSLGVVDPVGWYTENMVLVFLLALYNALIDLYFLTSNPGLTARPVLALEQWLVEVIEQWKAHQDWSQGGASKPIALYTAKLAILWAAQAGGGALAAMAMHASLNDAQRDAFYAARQAIDTASDGSQGNQVRTLLLCFLFAFFYNWTYDTIYRISPSLHQVSFARSPMYTFDTTVRQVAISLMLSTLVVFPITGSPMNFLVLASLNLYMPSVTHYWASGLYAAAETAAMLVSFSLACVIEYRHQFFTSSPKGLLFGGGASASKYEVSESSPLLVKAS